MPDWNDIRGGLIECMINNLCTRRGRDPRSGWFKEKYIWPMRKGASKLNSQSEVATIKTFAGFSLNLRESKKIYDQSTCGTIKEIAKGIIENAIYQILDWGGITNAPIAQKSYLQIITETTKLPTSIDEAPDCFKNPLENNIASWTKILAAWSPGKYFIYDSRVAIALTYFCQRFDFWRIPEPRGNLGVLIENGYREENTQEFETCYSRYIELLVELSDNDDVMTAYGNLNRNIRNAYMTAGLTEQQAIMAHIEKMLFMMKEKILTQY